MTKNSAGRVLGGRYTLLAPIAQGGMGEVWKARDRVTGRLVAAKVLRAELSGEELSLSRLRLEARNAMSVQHPNIANVQDSGEEDGRGWIVMELVDGLPLTHFLRGGARIGAEDLLPVLMQVAMALGAAASAGVVHRDIKPANILVRSDGMVKLTDFGISRATDQVDLTAAGMVMGTAQYLPPEQAMGEKATSIGDLYALGVIAYEAVAGRRPFTGDTQVDIAFSHVNDPVPPLPADVPGPFADVILHLLEKNPAKRPESGLALVRELSAAAKAMGVAVRPHPLPEPADEESAAEAAPPTPRAPFRPVAPVRHVPKRTLPADLLVAPAALSANEADPGSTSPGDSSGAPGAARADAPVGPKSADSADPRLDLPAAATSSAAPDPSASQTTGDPVADRRAALAARLKERAEARRSADAARAAEKENEAREAAERARRAEDERTRAAARSAKTPAPKEAAVDSARDRGADDRPRRTAPSRARGTGSRSAEPSGFPLRERRGPALVTRWHSLDARNLRADESGPAAPTAYNRSSVAPPVPLGRRIARAVLIALVVLAIVAIIAFAIHHMLGSLTSIVGEGRPVLEEVLTWPSPWAAV